MQTVLLFITCLSLVCFSHALGFGIVNQPVVDLRSQKNPHVPAFIYDPHQETQLLINECVQVVQHHPDGWTFVHALLQQKLVNGTWIGYPGFIETKKLTLVQNCPKMEPFVIVKRLWVPIYKRICATKGCVSKDEIITSVSMGTRFSGCSQTPCKNGWCCVRLDFMPNTIGYVLQNSVNVFHNKEYQFGPAEKRSLVVDTAMEMLGWVYFWGGRSAFDVEMLPNQKQLSGVDCSGLTGIAHQVNHIVIPRDARDQFAKSKNVTGEFQPGDLFFYGNPDQPTRITHVVMYIGNDEIVESTSGATNATLVSHVSEKFGVSTISHVRWGMTIPSKYILYWGTFFEK